MSRYLGPVDALGNMGAPEPVPDQEAQITHDIEEVVNTQTLPEQQQDPPTDKSQALTLQINADLKIHKIGQSALTNEYDALIQYLQDRGLEPRQFPQITIANGFRTKLKQTSKGYTVAVPRKPKKGTRAAFWRTFRKTTSTMYFDQIEIQSPEVFGRLKKSLEPFYKKRNKAIASYIMNSNRKTWFKIGLTLHFLYSKMVDQWTQAHLSPEKIGMPSYENRSTWREDTVLLMAEIQKDGWLKCQNKYRYELHRTENILLSLIKKYKKTNFADLLSGKKRALRRDIRRINARRKAIESTCDEINILFILYNGWYGYFDPVDDPDVFDDWHTKLKRWKRS